MRTQITKENVMKIIEGRNMISKGIITKAQAQKALDTVRVNLPKSRANRIILPENPGITVQLTPGVDLTKIRTPDSVIKNRWVLVGCKPSIKNFAKMMF